MATEISNGWRMYTVDQLKAETGGALAIGPFGSRMKADCYVQRGVPVIRGNNISDTKALAGEFVYISEEKAKELGPCNVYDGDLLFPHRGLIGEVGIVTGGAKARFILSTSLMKLTPNPRLADSLFLFYFFRSPVGRHELLKNASQVGTPGIATPLTSLRKIELLLPPLHEQRAIANVLGTLDDKIELNRRMNRTLEAMVQAIFKSWFVDFDPVRAKAAGQTPPGLDPKIAALFPNRFEQSERAEIPAGWRAAAISELGEINASTLGRNDELDRIEYIEISEVSRGSVANIQPFERGDEPSRARRRLRHGDTVMSTVRPERGSYFLCLHPSANLIASTGFAVITPTRAPWSFVHAALTRAEVFEHLGQQADGGAYPAIAPDIIGKWQVAWPDHSAIVEEFHKMWSPLYELAEENRQQSRTLAALRDALLPNLLSGQLRVSENQAVAEI